MNSLRILTGTGPFVAFPLAQDCVWDRQHVDAGQVSVPALLESRLLEIRQELVRFVYDTGRLAVGPLQVQAWLKAGDSLSMWWCSLLFEKHPKVTPDLYPALKLRALELYIEEGAYDHILLEGADSRADQRLVRTLEAYCQRSGRIFCVVSPRKSEQAGPSPCAAGGLGACFGLDLPSLKQRAGWKALGRRAYFALPAPCKAGLRLAAWLWQTRRHLPRTRDVAPPTARATIATYFPNVDPCKAREGRFQSRYWEALHQALAPAPGTAHKVHWLFMLFPSPQYSPAQCRDLRDAFAAQTARHPQGPEGDGASFHFLEEFLWGRDILWACLRFVWLAVTSACLQPSVRRACALPGSRMNLWEYLGPYYADSFRGWRCLERCLHRRAFSRYVAWAGPQEWTIFPLENCPWERMLTQAVHEQEKRTGSPSPVYGTQHSTLRPTDFRYFDDPRSFSSPDCAIFQPDRICGNGAAACEALRAAKVPESRLGMVEALRYLYLHKATGLSGTSAATEGLSGPSQAPRDTKGPRRLLIVTSFFADEVADHMRVLADAQAQGLLQGWEVTVKAHPYLAVDDYLAKIFPHPADFVLSTAPIGDLLKPSPGLLVVWASNSTTVALEAAVQGLPVLVQLPANDVDLCPLQGLPGLPRIACAAHLATALAQPQALSLSPDYLALDPALPRWRKLLGLDEVC